MMKHSTPTTTLILVIALLGISFSCKRSSVNYQPIAEAFEPDYQIDRFENEIKNFEKEDTEKGIKKKAGYCFMVVLVGGFGKI